MYFKKKTTINLRGQLTDLSSPLVMGILNITPDSFYDGGKYTTSDRIISRVEQILQQGGDMVDLGAYSSRPGAVDISCEEEWARLASALGIIRTHFPDVVISVDTFRAEIAKKGVENFEVDMINDISGGLLDPDMFSTVGKLNVPYILMHMKGNPRNMQEAPTYEDVVKEVSLYFSTQVEKLRQEGVTDIILDPGFGFGKTISHNYQLLNRMEEFDLHELPLLIGISRKSMIYKLLGGTAADSLNGTSVLNTMALERGANILRVHDVKEAKECINLVAQLHK
ncbi:dihydropteroate synthase [Marinilabiliaceae bacterium JC017]|nr:dihydropteroate synthase [Marinilabiliaceae bacterium JC017]